MMPEGKAIERVDVSCEESAAATNNRGYRPSTQPNSRSLLVGLRAIYGVSATSMSIVRMGGRDGGRDGGTEGGRGEVGRE